MSFITSPQAKAAGIFAGALFLGVAIGSAGGAADAGTDSTPATVHTVTKTKTVETTPASCLQALRAADETHRLASKGFQAAGDALTAVSNLDVDGINRAGAHLTAVRPHLDVAITKYQLAAADCRAHAGTNS